MSPGITEMLWQSWDLYRKFKKYQRLLSILGILTKHLLGHGFSMLRYKLTGGRHPGLGQRVRRLIEDLGPTYIKFGQVLSTRPEIPDGIRAELKKLQDQCPPFPYEQVKSTIEAELGAPIDELFLYFEKEPLAAASLGQVHRAILKNGDRVAVKVLRPGVEQRVMVDLDLLKSILRFLERISSSFRKLGLSIMLEVFETAIRREMDYILEGRNAEKFAAIFKGDDYVYIPKVYWDYTTKRVLTLEFLDGIKIDDVAGVERLGLDRTQISTNVLRAYLKQLLDHGFYHADPHPSNVFVQEGNRIAFLDFGMVGQISKQLQDEFAELMLGAMERNIDRVVNSVLRIMKRTGEINMDAFKADIQDLIDQQITLDGSAASLARTGGFFTELIYRFAGKYPLLIPHEMVYFGKVLLYAEGLAKLLDPNFDYLKVIMPHMQRFASRRIMERFDVLGLRDPGKLMVNLMDYLTDWGLLIRSFPRAMGSLISRLGNGDFVIRVENPTMTRLVRGIDHLEKGQLSMNLVLGGLVLGLILLLILG